MKLNADQMELLAKTHNWASVEYDHNGVLVRSLTGATDWTPVTDEQIGCLPALVEARNPKSGDWNSDYVGNEETTLNDAKTIVAELEQCSKTGSPDRNGNIWSGWWFRIKLDDGCGHYTIEM